MCHDFMATCSATQLHFQSPVHKCPFLNFIYPAFPHKTTTLKCCLLGHMATAQPSNNTTE